MMKQVTLEDYEVGPLLGKGKFAEVYRGTDKVTGENHALKLIKKPASNEPSVESKDSEEESEGKEENMMRVVKTEIEALSKLEHPNILRMLGIDHNASFCFESSPQGKKEDAVLLVLELATGGELFDFLFYTGAFSELLARSYLHQLIDAIETCHNQGVVHRDLKPENIFVDSRYNLKLGDFGLAHVNEFIDMPHFMRTQCGTRSYMAPEVLLGKEYTEKSDIFSMGVILFIFIVGTPPFQLAHAEDWHFRRLNPERREEFWNFHQNATRRVVNNDAKALLEHMMTADSDYRIDLEGIKESSWYQGRVFEDEELYKIASRRKRVIDKSKKKERLSRERKDRIRNARSRNRHRSVEISDVDPLGSILLLPEPPIFDPLKDIKPPVSFYTRQIDVGALLEWICGVFETLHCRYKRSGYSCEVLLSNDLRFLITVYRSGRTNDELVVHCQRLDGPVEEFYEAIQDFLVEIGDIVYEEEDDDDDENIEYDEYEINSLLFA